jgi:hypothetical protein
VETRDERLAGAGAAADAEPGNVGEHLEDLELLGGEADERGFLPVKRDGQRRHERAARREGLHELLDRRFWDGSAGPSADVKSESTALSSHRMPSASTTSFRGRSGPSSLGHVTSGSTTPHPAKGFAH